MIFHLSFSKFNTMQCDVFIDNNNLNSTFNPNLRSKLGCVDHFDNNPIIKFLGINFDPFLSFKNHIAQIASKISHSLFVLHTVKNLLSEDLIEMSKLKFMHSCMFNTLLSSFERTWLTVAEHRGNGDHQLSNDNDYYIPLSKNNTSARLPLINFPFTWNEFPDTSIKLERKKPHLLIN
jgi:hypothetical protein